MCKCLLWNAALGAIVLGNAFYQAPYAAFFPLLVCINVAPPDTRRHLQSRVLVGPFGSNSTCAAKLSKAQRSMLRGLGAFASLFRPYHFLFWLAARAT